MQSTDLFAIAQIVGFFGVKGYLKIYPLTHSPKRLNKLKTIRVGLKAESIHTQEVEDVEFQHKTILLKLKGFDDRTVVEQFIHHYIFVEKDELVKPPKGSWFIHDILGCEVFTEDGTNVGTIQDVLKISSNDIWEIRNGERSLLFPAVKEFIKKVDVKNRKILILPPDGLFDL
ncbi:MAG: 16S rRNA processing protein RimM [Ignavibacteriae bacterium]|nr:16S rRNA processing protein RimM [Ignavibacteriota bacterium]